MRHPGFWNVASIGFGVATIACLFVGVDGSPYLILCWVCQATSALMYRVDRRVHVTVTLVKEGQR